MNIIPVMQFKRSISLLLSAVLVVGLLPLLAVADESAPSGDGSAASLGQPAAEEDAEGGQLVASGQGPSAELVGLSSGEDGPGQVADGGSAALVVEGTKAPAASDSAGDEGAIVDSPALMSSGVEGDLALSPMGLLGGTAPKLDGDWAYLTKFEILDDPTTPGVVEGIQDGSGPFDTDIDPNSWTYKDRQGNDENDQNGKVRSFDTVTYKLNYATATSGEYDFVKEGWLNYEMVLPYAASRAVWQTDSMAWVGTKVADQAALDNIDEQTSGFFLATETRQGVSCQVLRGKFWIAPNDTNPYAIPGEGALSAVVQVLAMEEGDMLEPSFSGWMENNVTYQTTCGTHKRAEIKTFTAPATTVTAEVRLDIEMAGYPSSTIDTVDFNAAGTSASAPNYGKGSVVGKPITYNIGVYLGNSSVANKGRKGVMAPKSGDTLTFDLTLSESVTPTSGTETALNNTNYKQLLWALGSNDDDMNWYGRSSLLGGVVNGWVAANTAFDAFTLGNNACYNGGAWSYSVDSSNPNVIHVKVSGMQIDLTNYPHTNVNGDRNFDVVGAIPVSSGQMTTVLPIVVNDTHIMEDTTITGSAIGSGTIAGSIVDSNMSYTYVSQTDNQSHTLTNADQSSLFNDWSGYNTYAEKGSGSYDSHVMWSNAPDGANMEWISNAAAPMGDTTGSKYYLEIGGDPTVRNQSVGVWFGSYHSNDIAGDDGTVVAAKILAKFDASAVTPTGTVGYLEGTLYGSTATVLYATKQDGSNWATDDEMETTSMTALKYYSSYAAIPAGRKCVGVLVEYLPTDPTNYTGIVAARQDLYADVGLTVNEDAVEGGLYQCTLETYMWNKTDFEAQHKSIPSLLNTSTVAGESWRWRPDYNKGVADPTLGHLTGDTSGFRWGDVMQVNCARSKITKEVAQQENGADKSVYYMDSDQRFVDYKLQASTEYVTYNVIPPAGVTTTLTIVDELPSTLKFVSGSAYYGGTYTQSSVPGRQGTVVGGAPLTPTFADVNGTTAVTFEIPNITVGEPLLPIYFTAEIGTRGVESTDVQDGASIANYALSRVGAEITSQNAYAGLNAAGATIRISKNGATSRSKLADQTYIEKGDAFNWTINIGNNGGTSMPGTLALDTLPYVGDGEGTTFAGTLSLSKWNVDVSSVSNFSAANWKVMYTTDANVRGTVSSQYNADDVRSGVASGPNGVVFKDITTLAGASIDYVTGVVTLPAGFCPTAMVVVGTLPGNQTMRIAAQMKIANGEQGDILVNQLDGYPSPIYVVKRSIEGCTWTDANTDGIRQDEEAMLSGVTATLLKLKTGGDATKEADYEVVKDSSNNDVKVLTNKQIDSVTGATSDYAAGRYQFTNLVPGTYMVRFTGGTADGETSLSAYTASPVGEGDNDARDSDATPTYDAASGKLGKTVILGIVMKAADSTTKDVNQVARNNDSGLYVLPRALTVNKTVTGNLGDREKAFTFTVTLKDADGRSVSGSFDCASSVLSGSGATAPSYTSITFASGSATLQLKHGQQVVIKGLPDHCQYTVAETAETGYRKTVQGDESNANLRADATVAYTNNATVTTPTGILLDVWPYALALLLAGGAATAIVLRMRARRDGAGAGRAGSGGAGGQW